MPDKDDIIMKFSEFKEIGLSDRSSELRRFERARSSVG